MIIALYVIVLALTIVNYFVFKTVFESMEGIFKILNNFTEAETKQNKINEKIVTIFENDIAIQKTQAESIALLEKKLEEKDDER